MASHPPKRECCTTGTTHSGTARGKYVTISGVDAYVSYPATQNPKAAVLVLTDVIGHRFINSQLIADNLADQGYLVVMPDLFQGDAVPKLLPEGYPPFEEWVKRHGTDTVDPVVEAVLKEMRGSMGCTKIAAAGYCFGAKYVVRHLRAAQSKIDVGYIVHPTNIQEDELAEVGGPLCIDAAETDPVFPVEMRHKSEKILKEAGQPYMMTLFGGVEHGFAVRADLSKKAIRFAREESIRHCLRWFEEHL